MSITVDDSQVSCLRKLREHDLRATFFISKDGVVESPEQHKKRYAILRKLYAMGHEIGGHSYSHNRSLPDDDLRDDLVKSILYIGEEVRVSPSHIISMSWPYGAVQNRELAADYFLAVRGYHINELEDTTPKDFMNLKSFISLEHGTAIEKDIVTLARNVLRAEAEGKWAILVYHTSCDEDRIVDFAVSKDLWIAPLGTVIKYIIQRDRITIDKIKETEAESVFTVSRAGLPVSGVRDFEQALQSQDIITLKIRVDDPGRVSKVYLDGREAGVKKDRDGNLLLDLWLQNEQALEIRVLENPGDM